MTENTLILFKSLRHDIKDKLSNNELERLDDLIDDLTWTRYEREMVEGYCGSYQIYLVDGTKYGRIRFRYNDENNCFETDSEINHPQLKTRKNTTKTTYSIPDKIVKYIR